VRTTQTLPLGVPAGIGPHDRIDDTRVGDRRARVDLTDELSYCARWRWARGGLAVFRTRSN